jgi:hypothetical protein
VTAASAVRLRVMVTDTWDHVDLEAPPELTLAAVKRQALAAATGRSLDPAAYVIKYRGALVLDERVTVAGLQLSDGAPLIVLPGRRRPVR